MSNTENNLRDVYLAVTHYQRPAPGEHTHTKDWGKTAKWQIFEEAAITDSLKTKLSSSASIIINITKMRVEKNRFRGQENAEDEKIYISYMSKFSEEIAKFYVKYRPHIIQEMLEAKKQEEVNKKIKEMGAAVEVTEEPKIESKEEVQEIKTPESSEVIS